MAHKILLVDDDRINIALVKFALAEQRYEVIVAFDGDEGLEKVNKESPDLIILDVQMPRMNGYEFMAGLKRSQGVKTTPVLMLTANETMEDMFKLEGVKGYFVKPVDQQKLKASIVHHLGPNPI
jgi:CheY-like chemotaxis protein